MRKTTGHFTHSRAYPGIMAAAAAAMLVLIGAPVLTGCSGGGGGYSDAFSTNPITAESLEGLILEGEGPIPARLIYRSRNTISSEEGRLILEEIAQELDRLLDLAGRLDEAITDETAKTDQTASGGAERRTERFSEQ
jgi:hypothetical protein